MSSTSFSWRVFISTALTLAFVVLTLSGIILFVSPPGRVANWSNWQLLGLGKKEWQNQHIIFGFAFIILSVFHLFVINWKAFISYLVAKASKGLNHPAEILGSLALFFVLAVGTLYHFAPFGQIIELGEGLSGSWEKRSSAPPVPHAETLSLDELGRMPQVTLEGSEIVNKLRKAGVKVRDKGQNLLGIASENGMEVQKLYDIIVSERSSKKLTAIKGWGQKTLREAAETAGISPLSLQQALKQQGIESSPDERLREIAERHGLSTPELVEKIETMIEQR